MADVKISALPAATVPLAGTEVLPIVQSATTRQVSVANLTAGRSVGGTNFIPSGSSVPTNGMFLPAANTLGFSTNSTQRMAITSGGSMYLGATLGNNFSFTYGSAVDISGSGTGIAGTGTNLNLGVWNGPMVFQAGNDGTNLQERMRITSAGNVGIGTSSPAKQLDVYLGTTGTVGQYLRNTTVNLLSQINGTTSAQFGTETSHPLVFLTGNTERMRIDTSGNVGIGLSSVATGIAQRTLQIDNGSGGMILLGSGATQNPNPRIFGGSTYDLNLAAGITTGKMLFYTNDQNRLEIAANGIITMGAYGAGAATFSAAGVISSVSDETWKTKDGVPTNTDAMLQKLEPGYWFYNEEKAPTFGEERQLGFYAQNVHEAIGEEAAPTPEEGKPWGYYDRSVLAVTVMSLKNALNTIEELKQRITALENK